MPYTPIEDEAPNEDTLSEDQELDINAPIQEEDQVFAFYYPNVTYLDIGEAMKEQIRKELGL